MAKICFGQVVKNAFYLHNCFCCFFSTIEQAKRFQFSGKMFSIGFQNCVLRVQQSNLRRHTLFQRSFYILFFRILKEGSVFCEKFSRRESQFCVLPNHWDNSKKVFLLIEKMFLSPCFCYLEKCFWQSSIKNGEVFITAFCVFIRTFWWK